MASRFSVGTVQMLRKDDEVDAFLLVPYFSHLSSVIVCHESFVEFTKLSKFVVSNWMGTYTNKYEISIIRIMYFSWKKYILIISIQAYYMTQP